MSWVELSLDTTDEGLDWVQTLLATANYTGEIHLDRWVEVPADWAFTVRLYLPYDARARVRVDEIERQFSTLCRTGQTTPLRTDIVDQKPSLEPVLGREGDLGYQPIGEKFALLSTRSPLAEVPGRIPLRLAPSSAFGSGFHPATVLCLQLIERHVFPGVAALDLGSGSGILAVAMARLGAQVLAVDNDTVAVQATRAAAIENGVADAVSVMQGSLGTGSTLGHWMGGSLEELGETVEAIARFDLIAANILARVHTTLAADYRNALRSTPSHRGRLITGGFTTDYEDEVVATLRGVGFEPIDCERSGDWVAFAYQLQ